MLMMQINDTVDLGRVDIIDTDSNILITHSYQCHGLVVRTHAQQLIGWGFKLQLGQNKSL